MTPLGRAVVHMLPAWASNGWLTLRVSLGDWIIQLGHAVAGDPRCSIAGCRNRYDSNLHEYCLRHQSFINVGHTPEQLAEHR